MKQLLTFSMIGSAIMLFVLPSSAQEVLPVSINKPSNTLQYSDLASVTDSELNTYIVRLREPSIAQYEGGIKGFNATKLAKSSLRNTRRKLDINTNDVRAYRAYLKSRQNTILSTLSETDGSLTPIRQFQFAVNGMVVDLTSEQVESLQQVDGILSVEQDRKFSLNTDTSPSLIGAQSVWNGTTDSGVAALGDGTVVAIFDTGINTDHPSFAATDGDGFTHTNPLGSGVYLGDCATEFAALCNDKLIGVYSYALITNQYSDTDVFPAELARNGEDYNGHGSHVASTAAGNILYNVPQVGLAYGLEVSDGYAGAFTFDRVAGIAPHANIISFQTCLPGESDDEYTGCYASLAISAIEDAIETGIVDAINYSISGGEDIWGDSLSEAWLSAVNAGIFVAHSAGNSGPNASSSDKNAPWITPVGATDHGRSIDFSKTISGFSGGTAQPSTIAGVSNTGAITATVVYAGNYPNSNDPDGDPGQCLEEYPANTFNGEIVLCERGDIARIQKAINVAAGGAGGFILANVADGSENLVGDEYVIPGIHVDADGGSALLTWIESGTGLSATISTTAGIVSYDSDSTDNIASFSSRGPNLVIDTLLPMISAPGVDIYAAYSDEHYGHETTSPAPADYAYLDGTSMASPHVAGASLLLKDLHPDWSPDAIRSALMMTALTDINVEDSDGAANWFEMGAGRLQIDLAAEAGLIIEESQVNYLAADPDVGGDPKTLNIPALVDSNCFIACSWQRTVTATKNGDWTVAIDDLNSGLVVSASPSSFTLAAGESQTITVAINTQNANDGDWSFAQVVLSSNASPSLHLPVAVITSNSNLPDAISTISNRNSDSFLLDDLIAVEIEELTYDIAGLTLGTQVSGTIAQDSSNDAFLDDIDDGVYVQPLTVSEDTARLALEIIASTAPDLDLYVLFDDDGDGAISTADVVGSSLSYSWEESVDLTNLDAGDYYVVVQNYTGSGESEDTFTLEYALVEFSSEDASLTLDAPTAVTQGDTFDARLAWQLDNSVEGDRFYGATTLGSSLDTPENLGTLVQTIERGQNDVALATSSTRIAPGDSVSFTVNVAENTSNEDRDYEITVSLPDDFTPDPSSVSGSGIISGSEITWQLTQNVTTESSGYTVSDPQSDPTCNIPDVGQSQGYIDLTHFGYAPEKGDEETLLASYPVELTVFNEHYSAINVSSKGYLTPATVSSNPYPQVNRPMADYFTGTTLAPLWRDWSFSDSDNSGVIVANFKEQNITVIQWSDMEYAGANGDFEVILHSVETSLQPKIIYAYKDVSLGNKIAGTTVGLQNSDASLGSKLLYASTNDTSAIQGSETVIESGSVICFTPNASVSASGPTAVSFSASLNENSTATGTVAVTVSSDITNVTGTELEVSDINTDIEIHAAPVVLVEGVANASVSLTELQQSTLSISTIDDNGDAVTLSVSQTSGPQATFEISDNELLITPSAVDNGSEITLLVTATDEYGYSGSATVNVKVTENQPPELRVSAPSSVQEGGSISITATATDPEGDSVTFTINGIAGSSYTTTAQKVESDTTVSFTVIATDSFNSVSQTVTVTITNKASGGSLSFTWLFGLLTVLLYRRMQGNRQ